MEVAGVPIETAGVAIETAEVPIEPVGVKPATTWWEVSTRGLVLWRGPAVDAFDAERKAATEYKLIEPTRFKLESVIIDKPKRGSKRAMGRRSS